VARIAFKMQCKIRHLMTEEVIKKIFLIKILPQEHETLSVIRRRSVMGVERSRNAAGCHLLLKKEKEFGARTIVVKKRHCAANVCSY